MILERLTLCNFCLYRGEQTFNLAPQRRNGKGAPIILFGGINGGGKTTVLDAIQLALYGSRALCSKRGSLSYEQFLRECIHHGVETREGASLALSFRFAAEGEENLYEVCRAWSLRGPKVSEELYVSRDGVRDRWLSDNWNQMVEELVPLGISQLFFFDAEKIRFLAEDESCSAVLGSAIKSLLGLDLAERLIADAAAMESRCVRQIRSDEEAGEIAGLETQIQGHDAQLAAIREQAAALETEGHGALAMVRQAERRFAARGGEYWKERESRQERRGEVQNQEKTIEGQLTALAAGGLPLALLPDLLGRVAEQDQCEYSAAQARSLLEVLAGRDTELLQAIQDAGVPAKAVAAVRNVQDADRSRRGAAAPPRGEPAGAIRFSPPRIVPPAAAGIAGDHRGSRPLAGPTRATSSRNGKAWTGRSRRCRTMGRSRKLPSNFARRAKGRPRSPRRCGSLRRKRRASRPLVKHWRRKGRNSWASGRRRRSAATRPPGWRSWPRGPAKP